MCMCVHVLKSRCTLKMLTYYEIYILVTAKAIFVSYISIVLSIHTVRDICNLRFPTVLMFDRGLLLISLLVSILQLLVSLKEKQM